ncbi:MAG: CPBP family intramembrane metalloprotease [Planctomycetes bacterium]|nr:CPBP family intramembrane metalloprotease [Planctomycetota bacterium]MCB9886943.1 CPBP family intramembrane metalloprotease [Planctomycetota bacterium]
MNEPTIPPTAPLLGVRFVFGFALLAVVPSVVWDALRSVGVDLLAASDAERLEWSMAGFVVGCAAVVGFAAWQRPATPWRPGRALWVWSRYLPFLLLWVPLLVGYLWLAHRLDVPVPPQGALDYLATTPLTRPGCWLVVLGIVVGAPLAEEIVFRGFLQGALQHLLPRWLAIALTAAVFGLCHTLPYALPVGLLGAFFGWLFSRCGSLWPSVIAHATHNLVTVVVTIAWPTSLDLLYPK